MRIDTATGSIHIWNLPHEGFIISAHNCSILEILHAVITIIMIQPFHKFACHDISTVGTCKILTRLEHLFKLHVLPNELKNCKHVLLQSTTVFKQGNELENVVCQMAAILWKFGFVVCEILNKIQTFSLKQMKFKLLSAKWHPFCLVSGVFTTSSQKPSWGAPISLVQS